MEDQCFNPAKLFVGGLGQQSTEKSLEAYFGRFGTVKDAVVIVDRTSGRSRGFGFVVFDSHDVVEQCLDCRHNIDGVSVRRAVPRDEARGALPYDSVEQPGKVYVGGLPENVTEAKIRDYFAYYGPIRNVTLMYDKNSHRPRGFGFIVFENLTDAAKCWGPHPALGRMVEAKKAEPRPESRKTCTNAIAAGSGRMPLKPTWAAKGPTTSPYIAPSTPSATPRTETPTTSASSDAPRILSEWGTSWNVLPPLRRSLVTDVNSPDEGNLHPGVCQAPISPPPSDTTVFYPGRHAPPICSTSGRISNDTGGYDANRDPYKQFTNVLPRPVFDFEHATMPMSPYDPPSGPCVSSGLERQLESIPPYSAAKPRDLTPPMRSNRPPAEVPQPQPQTQQHYYPPSFSKSVSIRRHAGRSTPY